MTRAAEPLNGRPLKLDADPFTSTAASRQVQAAFREIVRQLIERTPVVLATGPASAGKTLLADMTARLCRDMGLSVRRVDRGDLLHIGLDQHSDVLLVDEANSVEDSILEAFSPERRSNSATTTIFLGMPTCVARFISSVHPVLIQFDLLSRSDAECYLREQAMGAGFTDLVSDDALELIVDASNGSPRLLRRNASAAFFNAASDCAAQIRHEHAASALAMQLPPHHAPQSTEQSVAAEDALLQPAKIDDDPVASEKAPLHVDGLSAGVEALSNERISPAEILSLVNPAPTDCQNADELVDNHIWIGTNDEIPVAHWEMSSRQSVAPTLMRRGALAACVAIVVAAFTLAIVRPWVRTGTVSPVLTALPSSPPVGVGTSGASEPTASPVIPSEVENTFKPETIQSAPKNAVQAEEETADGTPAEKSITREAAQSNADVPQPLTPEEEAAIARGIREMERAATQARAQVNRR